MTEGLILVKFRAIPLKPGGILAGERDLLNACGCGTVARLMTPDIHTQPDPKHFDQFARNYHDVLTQQLQASGLSADYFARQKARIILDEALPKASAGTWRLLDVGCGNGQLEALIGQILQNVGASFAFQDPCEFFIDAFHGDIGQCIFLFQQYSCRIWINGKGKACRKAQGP